MPLTEGQLKSKRDEFWDTAPAFEGKAEIWAALKAATEATEMQPEPDYQLAQVELFVILDGSFWWVGDCTVVLRGMSSCRETYYYRADSQPYCNYCFLVSHFGTSSSRTGCNSVANGPWDLHGL